MPSCCTYIDNRGKPNSLSHSAILPLHPGRIGKAKEIVFPALVRGAVPIGKDKMVRAGELPRARSGCRRVYRHVDQFQRPLERTRAVFRITFLFPADRAFPRTPLRMAIGLGGSWRKWFYRRIPVWSHRLRLRASGRPVRRRSMPGNAFPVFASRHKERGRTGR